MKATVSQESLFAGLRRVLNIVSTRTTLPALNNVLMECEDGKIVLTTTGLEVCIRTTLDADVTEAGATTLPAKKFAQIIGSLPSGEISLDTDDNQLTAISCLKSFFKIVGLADNEFPRDSEFSEEWGFTIPADEFKKSLAKVSYASSTDETRHVLNGILLSLRSGVLTMAATDGRRLALVERTLEGDSLPDGDVILPPKVVTELERTMPSNGDVSVKLSEARAAFSFGATFITSKLVEGTYPNYRQVIPANFTQSIGIPRETFAAVLNRVSMVVTESSSSVRLRLENGVVTISATSNEFGEANEPVDVSYEGEPFEIAFNPVFFGDPLRHLECDELLMQFNDEYSPVSIAGDEGFLCVVMPMRG